MQQTLTKLRNQDDSLHNVLIQLYDRLSQQASSSSALEKQIANIQEQKDKLVQQINILEDRMERERRSCRSENVAHRAFAAVESGNVAVQQASFNFTATDNT